jgi:hypothetical protein
VLLWSFLFLFRTRVGANNERVLTDDPLFASKNYRSLVGLLVFKHDRALALRVLAVRFVPFFGFSFLFFFVFGSRLRGRVYGTSCPALGLQRNDLGLDNLARNIRERIVR